MSANNSPARSGDAAAARLPVHDESVGSSIDIADLIDAIEVERLRLTRAHAVAQTAARLLHEMSILERNEPDIGFVLDVIAEMLEHSIGGLDRITADSL
jgi:hypothetical protein